MEPSGMRVMGAVDGLSADPSRWECAALPPGPDNCSVRAGVSTKASTSSAAAEGGKKHIDLVEVMKSLSLPQQEPPSTTPEAPSLPPNPGH